MWAEIHYLYERVLEYKETHYKPSKTLSMILSVFYYKPMMD